MKFSPHGITVIIAMEPLLSLSKPASLNLMMQVIMHIAAVVGDLARLRQNIYNYYFAKRERVSGFFSALWRVTPINKACVWSRHDANATDVGKMTLRWLLALCLMRRMPH
jgi:hypothetical protein